MPSLSSCGLRTHIAEGSIIRHHRCPRQEPHVDRFTGIEMGMSCTSGVFMGPVAEEQRRRPLLPAKRAYVWAKAARAVRSDTIFSHFD